MTLAVGAPDKLSTIWRFEQFQAMQAAKDVIEQVDREFGETFGRSYGGLVAAHACEDAEVVIVSMGGLATGAARDAVDNMRRCGVRAGVLKLRAFRPFPNEAVRQYLGTAMSTVVIDRDCSYGNEGAVCSEIQAALYGQHPCPSVTNFIGGLAGADLTAEGIQAVAQKAIQTAGVERHKIVFQYME
jgi:pyruvate ferredoxin oxidoreductase alpha subunit